MLFILIVSEPYTSLQRYIYFFYLKNHFYFSF